MGVKVEWVEMRMLEEDRSIRIEGEAAPGPVRAPCLIQACRLVVYSTYLSINKIK